MHSFVPLYSHPLDWLTYIVTCLLTYATTGLVYKEDYHVAVSSVFDSYVALLTEE